MIVKSTSGKPGRYSGKLIAFEGLDGSGKTTALLAIQAYLEYEGYSTLWTDWDRSPLTGEALHRGKDCRMMSQLTFPLLQAANIADRLERDILPHLQKGGIVLADRWIYTSYARDTVRGNDPAWLRSIYQYAPDADLVVYFDIDPKASLKRLVNHEGVPNVSYYEAGMDLKLAPDLASGFLKFQTKVAGEYQKLVKEFGFKVVDAERDPDSVQADVQKLALEAIGEPQKEAA